MKKLFILLCSVFVLSLNAAGVMAEPFTPEPGDYIGTHIREIQNPSTCLMDNMPGNQTIVILDPNTIEVTPWIDFMGMRITLNPYIGVLHGKSMHTETEDQILDMSPWGYDAVVTVKRPRGVVVWTSPTSFVKHFANQTISCEGLDCDEVAVWAAGDPAAEYPCNISPVTTEFVKMD